MKIMDFFNKRPWAVKVVLLLVVLFVLPNTSQKPFYRHVLILIGLYGLLGVAWNILGGYTGLFSFGQSAFFGIGAYTSSVALVNFGLTPWVGMLIGGIIAAIVGGMLAYPTSKLRGAYFTIASLAFARTMWIIFTNVEYVGKTYFGAATGLPLPLIKSSFLYLQFKDKLPYYYIILGLLAVAILTCYYIERSRLGFYFRAIRDSETVAESLGIDTLRYRVIAMAISAFFTAVAGTFYAQYVLYIDPDSVLHHPLSVEIVMVAALGGAGTIWGPVLGAAILEPISEYARAFFGGGGKGVNLILYGAIITFVAVVRPTGIMGFFKKREPGGPPVGTESGTKTGSKTQVATGAAS